MQYRSSLSRVEQREHYRLYREPILFSFSRGCFSLAVWRRFLSELRSSDTVLLNSPSVNILPFAIFTKLFRKRLVLFHQADIILPPGFLNTVIEWCFRIHTITACSLADVVSTYSSDYAEHSVVLRHFLSKCEPVRMPVEILPSSQTPSLPALQEKRSTSGPVFGFAGRFVHEKGFDVLLSAIPLIRKELPESLFVFAGETEIPYERFFEENRSQIDELSECVVLLGLLGEEELSSFYHSIDIFLMPSRSDCFGIVQAEAALAGKPIVVSDIPGCRDLVRQTGFGEIFRNECPASLAEAACRAFREQEDLQQHLPKVMEYLDNGRNSKQMEQLIAPTTTFR